MRSPVPTLVVVVVWLVAGACSTSDLPASERRSIIECNATTVGMPCDSDGTTCTQEVCELVAGEPICTLRAIAPDGTLCESDRDSCTADTCQAGRCRHDPLAAGSPCSDGDACTVNTTCDSAGMCGGGDLLDCDDGDACTADACDPARGCVATPVSCDDGDPCTADTCDPATGCDHAPVPGCVPPDAGAADAGRPDAGRPDAGGPDAAAAAPDAAPADATPAGDAREADRDAGFAGRVGGGGGCALAPRGGGAAAACWLALALCAAAGGRRRRALAAWAAAAAVAGAAVSARAGGLDASGYRPALSSTGFFARDGGAVLAPGAVEIALSLDAADDLLVVRDPRTGAVWPDGGRLVDARLTGTLGIAVGLFGRVELGAQMPVVLAQDGAVQRVRARGDLASTAAGDLRVGGKLRLLGSDALALSLAVDAAAPTGSADGFAGGSIAVTSRVVVGGRVGRFAFGGDVGYRARERAVVGDLAVDDEIVGGAATAVAVVRGRAWLVAEANAAVAAGGGGDTLRPVEVLAGVRWRPRGPWLVQAGVGAGVTEGYGAPRARGVIALRYAPVPRPAAGPRAPVRVVRRPTPPPAPKPPVDSDGDGVSDADDRCPLAPEDRDGFEDEDGCPDNDNDGDGIADRDDRCPLEREVVNGVDDADGCPDEGLIELVEDRIVLPNRVLFDTDRARVKHSGKKVLRAIVELWRQHPEWDRMLVQGHTDERGDADYNLWLSQRRAERVVRELVKLGVDPAKLEAQGFGETKPVAHGDSEEALQKNRRVEFVIIERRPPDAPGTGESGSGDGAGDAPAGGPRPVSPPGLQGS